MLKNSLLFIFVLFSLFAIGQNGIDNDVENSRCKYSSINYSNKFSVFISSGELDSASFILSKWEQQCEIIEVTFRARMLLNILMKKVEVNKINKGSFDYILEFIERVNVANDSNSKVLYEKNPRIFGYIPINTLFDKTIKKVAKDYITNCRNKEEELFCYLYSENIDTFFYYLQQEDYAFLRLRTLYDWEVINAKQSAEGHWQLSVGEFIPNSEMKLLGNHTQFGLSLGVRKKRFSYDLGIELRLGNTDYEYNVIVPDTVATDYFFGVQFGGQIYYDILQLRKHSLLISTSISVDGFDTHVKQKYGGTTVTVFVPGLGFGFDYRWSINENNYIGIKYRYNIVNYNNSKIVENLNGGYNTISLIYGLVNNNIKRNRLTELRFIE